MSTFRPETSLATLPRDLEIEGEAVHSNDRGVVAGIDRHGARIAWDFAKLGASVQLLQVAEAEAQLWDGWAGVNHRNAGLRRDASHFTLVRWLQRFPEFARTLDGIGVDLELRDHTILNIGGTGRDLLYWLGEGPRHIDHVEVSSQSQASCRAKVEEYIDRTGRPVSLTFHTAPAEHLPFRGEAFDFVFARSTIHHCARPQVFDQIVRVLKPGGVLLFSEFALNDVLYAMMLAHRRLRSLDRGSDDPLRPREIAYCETLFRSGDGNTAKVFMAPVYNMFAQRNRTRRASSATATKIVLAAIKGART